MRNINDMTDEELIEFVRRICKPYSATYWDQVRCIKVLRQDLTLWVNHWSHTP